MLLQLLNILMGVVVALPGLQKRGLIQAQTEFEGKISSYVPTLGLIGLVAGVIGFLIRIDLLPIFISSLGASYPQAIPAILLGLLLAAPHFQKYQLLKQVSDKIRPYAFEIGIIGIACGLGSLLFGCILPVVCHVPF
ncbi:MAG: MotA/TolQ/ExbB proton channel family protein [Patescibacteria group bacterium]